MKKLIYTLFFVFISVVANGQAKYVFYFIGDGMGVNQVNGTEMYQAEIQNGRIGALLIENMSNGFRMALLSCGENIFYLNSNSHLFFGVLIPCYQ